MQENQRVLSVGHYFAVFFLPYVFPHYYQQEYMLYIPVTGNDIILKY